MTLPVPELTRPLTERYSGYKSIFFKGTIAEGIPSAIVLYNPPLSAFRKSIKIQKTEPLISKKSYNLPDS
jgi:hypothetical protein